jgi:hypothetical protein
MRLMTLVLLVLFALPAAAQQLYRWKDANGVVQYTDSPPPRGQAFETRAVVNDPDPPAEPNPALALPNPPSERCLQARANLQVFDTSQNIRMDVDGDGVEEVLEGELRQREHERARELVGMECG